MKSKASNLEKYLETRRCTKKTGKDYHSEPHDEWGKEFNKHGLNFGVTKTAENFINNFSVADSYFKIWDNLFQEYYIKKDEGECLTTVIILKECKSASLLSRIRGQSYIPEWGTFRWNSFKS